MKTTTEQLDTMTVTKVITRSNLRTILEGVNNPDMISFVSKTPEKMNQYLDYWVFDGDGKKRKNPNPTPNPFYDGGVYNLSRKYMIVTGFDYEKSVNRRLVKEGKEPNFVGGFSEENKMVKDWYTYTDDKGVSHKTYRKDVNGEPILVEREVWFDVISKGLVTDKKTHSKFYLRYEYCPKSTIGQPEYFHNGNLVEKQMFESFLTKKSEGYSNQGLDEPLPFQVCDLNNILFLSMGGEVYELID